VWGYNTSIFPGWFLGFIAHRRFGLLGDTPSSQDCGEDPAEGGYRGGAGNVFDMELGEIQCFGDHIDDCKKMKDSSLLN
jgi:hypothetical protein